MRTSELTDVALDWAVAKCEGLLAFGYRDDMGLLRITLSTGETEYFKPTIDWSQGGPIIERERITVIAMPKGSWATSTPLHTFHQPTPLIAAMRCYVASKLGDDVDVPTKLTQGE